MLGIAGEAGEQGPADAHPAYGLGDPGRAAAEVGEPVPLAGVVALGPVSLLLANRLPALRDQHGISFQAIGAGETHTPALQVFEEPLQGSSVTTAQLPVEEPSRSAIPSRLDPVLAGPFLRERHMSSSSTTTARPSGLGFWA